MLAELWSWFSCIKLPGQKSLHFTCSIDGFLRKHTHTCTHTQLNKQVLIHILIRLAESTFPAEVIHHYLPTLLLFISSFAHFFVCKCTWQYFSVICSIFLSLVLESGGPQLSLNAFFQIFLHQLSKLMLYILLLGDNEPNPPQLCRIICLCWAVSPTWDSVRSCS